MLGLRNMHLPIHILGADYVYGLYLFAALVQSIQIKGHLNADMIYASDTPSMKPTLTW